jgi:hypothetical protein
MSVAVPFGMADPNDGGELLAAPETAQGKANYISFLASIPRGRVD